MGKKLTKLVYENLENLECNEPIFISIVISILPPVTLALLLFSSTSFSTAILLHFRTTKIFYMLRSTDSQYIILTILLNSRYAFLHFYSKFTPWRSISIFSSLHLKLAHYLLSLSLPSQSAFPHLFPITQDFKTNIILESSLI